MLCKDYAFSDITLIACPLGASLKGDTKVDGNIVIAPFVVEVDLPLGVVSIHTMQSLSLATPNEVMELITDHPPRRH